MSEQQSKVKPEDLSTGRPLEMENVAEGQGSQKEKQGEAGLAGKTTGGATGGGLGEGGIGAGATSGPGILDSDTKKESQSSTGQS